MTDGFAAEGGCDCGAVRYEMTRRPLFVHCCHCRWCQRETGSAFALNAMIESEFVALRRGIPQTVWTPSESGRGQRVVRCPTCQLALWSHYGAAATRLSSFASGPSTNLIFCPGCSHLYRLETALGGSRSQDAGVRRILRLDGAVAESQSDTSARHERAKIDRPRKLARSGFFPISAAPWTWM